MYVELKVPYTNCNALSELLPTGLVNGHIFWLLLRIQAPLSLFYIDEVALDMYITITIVGDGLTSSHCKIKRISNAT